MQSNTIKYVRNAEIPTGTGWKNADNYALISSAGLYAILVSVDIGANNAGAEGSRILISSDGFLSYYGQNIYNMTYSQACNISSFIITNLKVNDRVYASAYSSSTTATKYSYVLCLKIW